MDKTALDTYLTSLSLPAAVLSQVTPSESTPAGSGIAKLDQHNGSPATIREHVRNVTLYQRQGVEFTLTVNDKELTDADWSIERDGLSDKQVLFTAAGDDDATDGSVRSLVLGKNHHDTETNLPVGTKTVVVTCAGHENVDIFKFVVTVEEFAANTEFDMLDTFAT